MTTSKTSPLREELGMKKERFIQITVAVLVVAIALLIWGLVDRADARTSSATVVQITGDDSDAVRYEVTSEDGTLTILENGKPMPEERILRKGKTLILLDEEGRAVFQALVGENGEIEFSQNIQGRMRIPRAPRVDRAAPRPGLYVGISAGRVSHALAAQLGLESGQGILVNRVFPDSPAVKAGLEQHDIILEIDGQDVDNVSDLRRRMREMKEGDSMTLEVLRAGKQRTIEITPEPRKGERVLYFGELPEIGDPPTPPSVYHFDEDGDWSVETEELPELPGSVRFFGDKDDIAVYAPGFEYEKALALREDELKAQERQLEEMQARLEKLEAMIAELLAKQQR